MRAEPVQDAGPVKTWPITLNLLTIAFVGGAAGAPIVGALRESVQEAYDLPFWAVGAAVGALGALAGAMGLAITSMLRRVGRLQFVRAGLATFLIGFVLLWTVPASVSAVALWMLAAGWFLTTFGRGLTLVSNAVFTDLWAHRPHTGVILLHAVNAGGKLAAPAVALALLAALGTGALQPNAGVYAAMLGALVLAALAWPKSGVAELNVSAARQRPPGPSILRQGLFWLICVEFLFISGSEAGVASILASFVERQRAPALGMSARGWSQVVLAAMQTGILGGRLLGVWVSGRLGEKAIIAACLLCALAALPTALATSAAIYAPAALVLGVAFSAVWPAHFSLAARHFPHDKTALAMGAGLGTLVGVNGFVLLASLAGNNPDHLGWALIASTAGIGVYAVSLLTVWCRRRPAAIGGE
jgi:fucose permease